MEIKRVAAGGNHSLMIAFDGTLWATGSNNVGQLGTGEAVRHTSTPSQVLLPGRCNMVDAGPHSSVCVLETGEVYSWGDPVEGQLGHGPSIEEPLFYHYQIKARTWNQATPKQVLVQQ